MLTIRMMNANNSEDERSCSDDEYSYTDLYAVVEGRAPKHGSMNNSNDIRIDLKRPDQNFRNTRTISSSSLGSYGRDPARNVVSEHRCHSPTGKGQRHRINYEHDVRNNQNHNNSESRLIQRNFESNSYSDSLYMANIPGQATELEPRLKVGDAKTNDEHAGVQHAISQDEQGNKSEPETISRSETPVLTVEHGRSAKVHPRLTNGLINDNSKEDIEDGELRTAREKTTRSLASVSISESQTNGASKVSPVDESQTNNSDDESFQHTCTTSEDAQEQNSRSIASLSVLDLDESKNNATKGNGLKKVKGHHRNSSLPNMILENQTQEHITEKQQSSSLPLLGVSEHIFENKNQHDNAVEKSPEHQSEDTLQSNSQDCDSSESSSSVEQQSVDGEVSVSCSVSITLDVIDLSESGKRRRINQLEGRSLSAPRILEDSSSSLGSFDREVRSVGPGGPGTAEARRGDNAAADRNHISFSEPRFLRRNNENVFPRTSKPQISDVQRPSSCHVRRPIPKKPQQNEKVDGLHAENVQRSASLHARGPFPIKPQRSEKVDGLERRGQMMKKGKQPISGSRPPRSNTPRASRSTHARAVPRERNTSPRRHPRPSSNRSLNSSGVHLCNRSVHTVNTVHTSAPSKSAAPIQTIHISMDHARDVSPLKIGDALELEVFDQYDNLSLTASSHSRISQFPPVRRIDRRMHIKNLSLNRNRTPPKYHSESHSVTPSYLSPTKNKSPVRNRAPANMFPRENIKLWPDQSIFDNNHDPTVDGEHHHEVTTAATKTSPQQRKSRFFLPRIGSSGKMDLPQKKLEPKQSSAPTEPSRTGSKSKNKSQASQEKSNRKIRREMDYLGNLFESCG